MIASYLIVSFVLVSVGAGFYFFWLRNKLSALHAKKALLWILLLSFCFPFLVPELPNYAHQLTNNPFYYEDYKSWNIVDIEDKSLQDCYSKASNSKDYCHCEVIQQANKVSFEENIIIDFFIDYKVPIYWSFALIALAFLLIFIAKTLFLVYIIRNSLSQKKLIDGTSFYLLYPNLTIQLPIAAFSLWKNYIIWSPILDQLSDEEQKAVFLHEIAHLRQKDSWQQMLLHLLKVVWWPIPALYLISREFKILNEFVADEFAAEKVGNAHFYANILLRVKEGQQGSPSFTLSFAKSILKKRIIRLVQPSSKKHTTTKQFRLYLATLTICLWAIAAYSLPNLQKQDVLLKKYEVLKNESHKTGQKEFCKSCLVEQYNKQ